VGDYATFTYMNRWPRRLHSIFHTLWSRDVGTPGYDKSLWKEMDRLISELAYNTTAQIPDVLEDEAPNGSTWHERITSDPF